MKKQTKKTSLQKSSNVPNYKPTPEPITDINTDLLNALLAVMPYAETEVEALADIDELKQHEQGYSVILAARETIERAEKLRTSINNSMLIVLNGIKINSHRLLNNYTEDEEMETETDCHGYRTFLTAIAEICEKELKKAGL